jgi:signal peptidase I
LNSETPQLEQAETMEAPRQEVRREIVEFVKLVVWFLVLFVVLRTYVIEGYEVQGPSMEPTLHDRERILVFKFPHLISQISLFSWVEPFDSGDIVVFKSPDELQKRYVKRVIAVGPNVRPNTVVAEAQHGSVEFVPVEIEDGKVYINHQLLDEPYLPKGIAFGRDEANAEVLAGELYVMGDNRGVSKDSRAFGPIDSERIIGRAALRFWPLSRFGFIR